MRITQKNSSEIKGLGLLTILDVKKMLDSVDNIDYNIVKTEEDRREAYANSYGKVDQEIERIYRPYVYLDWNGRKEMRLWLNTIEQLERGEYYDMVNQFNGLILRAKK
jgi:predicted RNA-binding protein with EMAP domain